MIRRSITTNIKCSLLTENKKLHGGHTYHTKCSIVAIRSDASEFVATIHDALRPTGNRGIGKLLLSTTIV
jgi:hypothetical protein